MYTHLEDNVPKGRPGLELALILNPSPWGRRTLRPDPPYPSESKGLGAVELCSSRRVGSRLGAALRHMYTP
ncbi:hypothetical protein Lepto7375DRAFT_6575 [Leptolyngbya sp. PCC 7375]|nr:hypothetical protein Lepto7375DRAFT_6575 [Leptolyngbya sp. PCC 7375]